LPLQGFKVTHPIFDKLRTWSPVAFYHFMPNDIFHCQTPLKNGTFDLFGSEKCQLANLVANRDWLFVEVLQAFSSKHAFPSKPKQ